MRRALLTVLPFMLIMLTSGSCADEGDDGNPRCDDCDNADSCPSVQPTINPLLPCDVVDAQCFYCGQVMRRFVCQDQGGNLQWIDNGEADMCPPPSNDSSGGDGDGGTG
jgi:hypothetical protein